ncbi:MAG: phosphotransferase [Pseudomonadota bacterium]
MSESLNWDRLDRYLARHVPGYAGPLEANAFAAGQSNPTYLLTTPNARYVLRKKPPGALLKSAHAVDREYKVQRALVDTDVPVARVLHLCWDESILGTIFYVMEHVDGCIFWDPALPDLTPSERTKVYDEMNRVLASIHSQNVEALGLDDYGRPDGYFERQLKRWTAQYRSSQTETIPAMDRLIDWLERNLPEDDGAVSLVHGDYRIDNLMFDPNSLQIKAVFDWELSTIGHPLADLAYQVMHRSLGRDWHLRGLAGLDVEALGIPSEEAYVDAYMSRRGLSSINNWHFAKVFAFFRFSAICQGVMKRDLDGISASPDAAHVGAMARPVAEIGAELIGLEPGQSQSRF